MSIETQIKPQKFGILYVDDEETSLSLFQQAFGDEFRIFTAPNAKAGLELLKQHANEIGILMTDQQMPGEKGVWLLEHAREFRPQILRILVTAYSEMKLAIQAVNTGAIYKYVTKPWDPSLLEQMLKRGLDFYAMQLDREELLKERSALLRERMIANRIGSLGLVAAGLSQNIRNSMVAVKTFLELVEEQGGSGHLPDPELLHRVRSDIDKVVGLLADLRIVSPNPSDAPFADQLDLKSLLDEILSARNDALTRRRIAVDNQVPAGLPPVHGDAPMLRRLFELLFTDELAMLPAGSRIQLLAAAADLNAKPGLTITIADNGPALFTILPAGSFCQALVQRPSTAMDFQSSGENAVLAASPLNAGKHF